MFSLNSFQNQSKLIVDQVLFATMEELQLIWVLVSVSNLQPKPEHEIWASWERPPETSHWHNLLNKRCEHALENSVSYFITVLYHLL